LGPFLDALADELLELWDGVEVQINDRREKKRVALIMASADMPAAHKLGGFVAVTGCHGCRKCVREFKRVPNGTNKKGKTKSKGLFGGFDAQSAPRTYDEVKEQSKKYRAATNKATRTKLARESGVTYTPLMRLPYFNTIEMIPLDMMHLLYLGLCKNALDKFKEKGYLTPKILDAMQEDINQLEPPSDVPRIRMKISANLSRLKADELRLFTCVYGEHVLLGRIPEPDYKAYLLLVNAVRLYSLECISEEQIQAAHDLLHEYNLEFERIYGEKACTPNMHASEHLPDDIRTFGPAPASWVYAFERLYSKLGQVPNNGKQVELSIMRSVAVRRSLVDIYLAGRISLTKEQKTVFDELMDLDTEVQSQIAREETFQSVLSHLLYSRAENPARQPSFEVGELIVKPSTQLPDPTLSLEERKLLKWRIEELHPEWIADVPLLMTHMTSKATVLGHVLSSEAAAFKRSAYVLSMFSDHTNSVYMSYPGRIQYFIEFTATLTR
jgi:hypothetical protein